MTKEEYLRCEIVARYLIEVEGVAASIFAESRFDVEPDVIRLQWNADVLGKMDGPAMMAERLTAVLRAVKMPHAVEIKEGTNG